ncbi:MAG: hypothetical protein XD95_0384 [Microgenomates bacterium 39_7]|nr:MAG: hypothetical protein XD95_0384 [Microgenomates bacterium 39_7]
MFTPTLKSQISNFAQEKNLSFSAAVRELTTQALKGSGQSGDDVTRVLLKLADGAIKGPSDLAENDSYIYGKKASK